MDSNIMPQIAKRGVSEICKQAISAFNKLSIEHNIPLVCASQFGCWQQIVKLGEQYFKEEIFSPAIFSKISHNTFGGMISILNRNTFPYTSIAAGEKTFEMGLIEAFIQPKKEIAYVYADESAPEILQEVIAIKPIAFATLISKNKGDYKVSFVHNVEAGVKTVYDFVDFLNHRNEFFETSSFVITRV